MSGPMVTVLMCVHNGVPYIQQALASICGQVYSEWECIVIDDASTDDTLSVCKTFKDSRIRVVRNQVNMGHAASLNVGLDLIRTPYIARLDHDDVCAPDRLSRQIAVMEQDSSIAVCGTSAYTYDEATGQAGILRWPCSDLLIRMTMAIASPFIHPSVMIRKDALDVHHLRYNVEHDDAEDYELWTRLLRYGKGKNIEAPLITYRIRSESISGRRKSRQRVLAERARSAYEARYSRRFSEEERTWISGLVFEASKVDLAGLHVLDGILELLSEDSLVDHKDVAVFRRNCLWHSLNTYSARSICFGAGRPLSLTLGAGLFSYGIHRLSKRLVERNAG